MKLTDYITDKLIFVLQGPLNKQVFFDMIVDHLVKHFSCIDKTELLQKLNEREENVSTGIGHGVAIPHATVKGIRDVQCIIAKIPEGVDFNSLDSLPVHIAFLVLSPPGRTGEHLRLLARIARFVSKGSFLSKMISAKSTHDIFSVIAEEDKRHV